MVNTCKLPIARLNRGTPPDFYIAVEPQAPACNLDCRYCSLSYEGEPIPAGRSSMTAEFLDEFSRQTIQSQKPTIASIVWQGGEPTLMGIDFYRRAVECQNKYCSSNTTIRNTLRTNATLIDDDWGQFFKHNQFLVEVVLDGPQEYHDSYRVDKEGHPTFKRVLSGIEILKKHQVDFNILTFVHAANADHPLSVYRFLQDQVGAGVIQFVPVVERNEQSGEPEGIGVGPISVRARQYGHFLIRIFDEWVLRDVGRVYVQLFESALAAWLGQKPGWCAFEEQCGLTPAILYNGDLYACSQFTKPECYLGNIHHTSLRDLLDIAKENDIRSAKRGSLPNYCMECDVRFMCNGGCPANRIIETPEGELGLNILCEGYRAFFKHIDRPMKLMAALVRMGRSAADVSRILIKEGYRGGTGPLGTRRLPRRPGQE